MPLLEWAEETPEWSEGWRFLATSPTRFATCSSSVSCEVALLHASAWQLLAAAKPASTMKHKTLSRVIPLAG